MKKIILSLLVSFGLLVSASASGHTNVKGAKVISAKKAEYLQRKGNALFLDARGYKLYKKGTIPGSLLFPVKKYDHLKKLLPSKDIKIVTFCNGYKCEKSDELAQKLIDDGYKNILIYKGGFPEWKEKGFPVFGLVKKCKEAPKGPYKPTKETTINGIKVYVGEDQGMIDQFWFAQMVNKNTIPKGIQLVDIRKPKQFKESHLKGAINIPQNPKTKTIDPSLLPKDKVIVFYCNTGMMSSETYVTLPKDKRSNVLYFDANMKCNGSKCTMEANENL